MPRAHTSSTCSYSVDGLKTCCRTKTSRRHANVITAGWGRQRRTPGPTFTASLRAEPAPASVDAMTADSRHTALKRRLKCTAVAEASVHCRGDLYHAAAVACPRVPAASRLHEDAESRVGTALLFAHPQCVSQPRHRCGLCDVASWHVRLPLHVIDAHSHVDLRCGAFERALSLCKGRVTRGGDSVICRTAAPPRPP
jgi:hypothetical protein